MLGALDICWRPAQMQCAKVARISRPLDIQSVTVCHGMIIFSART
jgi:hypothetical protein